MARDSREVVVVGAGIAGLAAARELKRRGLSPLVLESAAEAGGRVRTEHWADARIELGAHVVTRAYTRTLELIDELGLRGELIPIENAFRTAVRRDSGWHYVDCAQPLSLVRFSAIGWRDKLSLLKVGAPALTRAKALRYGDIATAAPLDNSAAADVVTPDALGFYIGPLYEAFFGYRPAEISYAVMALGMLSRGRPLTLANGMGALSAKLAEGIEIETGVRVDTLTEEEGRVSVAASTRDGSPIHVVTKAAILATPASETGRIWHSAPGPVRDLLARVAYSRADRVYLRTREPSLPAGRRGRRLHMELVPGAERRGRPLALIEFMHQRAASGGLLYAEAAPGGAADQLGDGELADALQDDVERLHPELRREITGRRVVRTAPMTPLFPAGQSRRLAAFRQAAKPRAIELAGDYLRAPWIEGAAVSGEAAAARVEAFLQNGG